MKLFRYHIALVLAVSLLALLNVPVAQAQDEWPCDATLYIAEQISGPESRLYTIDRATGTLVFQGDSGLPTPSDYNALAYNPIDAYMYAVRESDGTYYRVGNDSVSVNIGSIGAPPNGGFWWAGTFWYDGLNWVHLVLEGGTGANPHRLVHIDPTNPLPPVPPPPIGSFSVDITPGNLAWGDIATHPLTNVVYGSPDSPNRNLYTIDPVSGVATVVGPMQDTAGNQYYAAALFFDVYGQLWGYTDVQPPAGYNFVNLVRIDTATGAVTPVSTGAGTSRSDGTSCPYTLYAEKTVSPASVAQGGVVTYTYVIRNNNDSSGNITFQDIMPDARTFVGGTLSVSNGTGTPNSYGGTNTLTINNVTIPAATVGSGGGRTLGIVTITVNVNVGMTPAGEVFNQATLSNLPPNLHLPGDGTLSDYPPTNGYPDETPLTITAALPTSTPPPAATPGQRTEWADPVVIKSANVEAANIGDTVVFTLRVRNPGNSPANHVVIEDPIHEWLDVVEVSATRGTINLSGRVVVWEIGTLQPGEELVATITAVVNQQAVMDQQVCNQAGLVASGFDRTSNEVCVTLGLGVDTLPETGGEPIE